MKKKLSIILFLLILSACGKKDGVYYSLNPNNFSSSPNTSKSLSVTESNIFSSSSSTAVDSSQQLSIDYPNVETGSYTRLYSWQKEEYSADFLEFFDTNSIIKIDIQISSEELIKINDDFLNYDAFDSKSDIYRICDVSFEVNGKIYFFDEVGIRMKGETSRRKFINENGVLHDIVSFKLSFSQTFDSASNDINGNPEYQNRKTWTYEERKNRKNRRFFGMEKLDLKFLREKSYIKNLYAGRLLDEVGVLSAKSTLGAVSMTRENVTSRLGVFNILEPIDEHFLDKRIASEELGGDLYKCVSGATFSKSTIDKIGVEDPLKSYFPNYSAKTNESKGNFASMTNFINSLNEYSQSNFENKISDILEVNYFLKYEAMQYILGNLDDLRNSCHNAHIYFLRKSKKAIFISNDNDHALGITRGWNPNKTATTHLSPYSIYSAVANPDLPLSPMNRPLYQKTILVGGNMKMILAYHDFLLTFIKFYSLTPEAFNEVFNIYSNTYSEYTTGLPSHLKWIETPFNNMVQPIIDSTTMDPDFGTYIRLKKDRLYLTIEDYK